MNPSAAERVSRHTPASILVIEGEAATRKALERALGGHGTFVEVVEDVAGAAWLRSRYHFDLLVLDVGSPLRQTQLDWLGDLRAQGTQTDAIVTSASGEQSVAVEALRAGARDFIQKPFRLEDMVAAVERCLAQRRRARERFVFPRRVRRTHYGHGMIGASPAMRELSQAIARVASAATTVLIEGETGVGKELVARAIHELSGRQGAFVPVNCGSISAELLESELFGHVKGAFTGAYGPREGLFHHARGGTLFLDEVSEMPLPMQAKLLRVLEDKVVRPVGADREYASDARIVAATNRALTRQVAEGRFREDVYYRLHVVTLRVPPLRERLDDLATLAEHFSSTLAASLDVAPIPFTEADHARLRDYPWPGNVRELKNLIERSLLLGRLPGDCCPELAAADTEAIEAPLDWSLSEVEKRHILKVLEHFAGNKSRAARRLGVSRKTLERKLQGWRQPSALTPKHTPGGLDGRR